MAGKSGQLLAWVVVLLTVLVLATGLSWWVWSRYSSTPGYRLRHGAAEERQWAIRMLVEAGPSSHQWKLIEAALSDPDPAVQLTAIAALGRSGRHEHILMLVNMMDARQPLQIRLRALEALAEAGGDIAAAKVRQSAGAAEPEVRALATRLMPRFNVEFSVPLLRSLLTDDSQTVRLAAADSLNDLAVVSRESGPCPAPSDGPIVWEAERGIRIRQNFEFAPSYHEIARLPELAKTDPMWVGLDGWSGDGWIQCLEGGGGNHEWLGGESGSIDIGRIDYPIAVPRSGRYTLWARMWFTDKCGDSYYAQFERQPRRLMEHPWEGVLGEWRLWFWLTDHNGPVELEAGPHTLHVQVREDGIRIDQFCLVPEGSAPPDGPLQANLDPLELASNEPEVALSRESEIADSSGRLRATVRVMRCGPADLDGVLELDAEDGKLDCPARVPVKLAGAARVFAKDFTVQFDAGAPCRERVLSARFIAAGRADAQTASLVIAKPWPWLIAGPFSSPRDARAVLDDPAVTWQAIAPEKLFNRYGTMDFENVFGNGASGHVVLKARIRCERGGTFLWLLNSDDASKVWLDGRLAIANPRVAPAEGFLTRARVEVAPGEHTIVATVSQAAFGDGHIYNETQNDWLFRLRVRAEEHKPAAIEGVAWETEGTMKDER
ncbi:MAG TPA: HEAT repeat domain-containing protein [Planctomycetota bacterium]|nr:HEAT repeat domain-containing protein [Planctomycetota bacterium]